MIFYSTDTVVTKKFKTIKGIYFLLVFLILTISCKSDPEVNLFVVEVFSSDGGEITNSGGQYESGHVFNVTAIPDEGYRFVRWDGINNQNEETISFEVNSNLSITAVFERIPVYTFELRIHRGSVEIEGVEIIENRPLFNQGRFILGTFQEGDEIRINVIPNEGYEFSSWNGIDETNQNIVIVGSSDITLEPIVLPIICPDGDCWVRLFTDFGLDNNGYYHVEPEWYSGGTGSFKVFIDSSPTTPVCQSNGVPVIQTRLDSDVYWEVESGLSFIFGIYNPFQSFNTQNGTIIKVRDTVVNINYFQGEIVSVVQPTGVYSDVKDKISCWGWINQNSGPTVSETGNCVMLTEQLIGPLIREMIGDTITIHSETLFDCGTPNEVLRDSIRVIIE